MHEYKITAMQVISYSAYIDTILLHAINSHALYLALLRQFASRDLKALYMEWYHFLDFTDGEIKVKELKPLAQSSAG